MTLGPRPSPTSPARTMHTEHTVIHTTHTHNKRTKTTVEVEVPGLVVRLSSGL